LIARPVRTLVVDDHAIGGEALCAALNCEGHCTRHALSGIEAVAMVASWVPDVIILDINMPEFDGYQTASILRKLDDTREVGIIAFTALSAANVIEKAQSVGIDAYCQKGTTIDRLLLMVDQFVRSKAHATCHGLDAFDAQAEHSDLPHQG
jgi:CheY-like chemotaxis protein